VIPNQFRDDERAIEGLPIRLVIALVVGVAALALMMNMLSGLGGMSKTEVDWAPQSGGGSSSGPTKYDAVVRDSPSSGSGAGAEVKMVVRDENGHALSTGKVIVKAGSAQLRNGPIVRQIGSDGKVTLDLDGGSSGSGPDATLRPSQSTGDLIVEIQHPDSKYQDKETNTKITVAK